MKTQQYINRRHEGQLAPTFKTSTTILEKPIELSDRVGSAPNVRVSFFAEHGEGHFEGDGRTVVREVTVQFNVPQLEALIEHLNDQLRDIRAGWTDESLDEALAAAVDDGYLLCQDGKWWAPDPQGNPMGGGWDEGQRMYALANAIARREQEEAERAATQS
jgi:hypothetical protein